MGRKRDLTIGDVKTQIIQKGESLYKILHVLLSKLNETYSCN